MKLSPTRTGTQQPAIPPPTIPVSEQGYVLLVAIFLLALLVISLAAAAPQVAKSIQRDRDLETFHRGLQYRRAVQLYYRKFHSYPPNMDALVKTNNIRFLRKRYVDPITGKADWKPVMYGQNKTPTAMGFFGQPLAGNASTIAGTGPSGGNVPNGSSLPGGISSILGGGSSLGSPGSSFGSSSLGGSSSFGNSSFDNSGSGSSQSPSAGTSGSGTGSTGTPASGTGTTGSSGTGSDQSGQTFGGVGIIGFSPASTRQSILVYKKKNHYNEWEFTYDPISDLRTQNGGNTGAIGQAASSTSTPIGTTTTPAFGGPPSSTPNPSPNPNPAPMPPDILAPQ